MDHTTQKSAESWALSMGAFLLGALALVVALIAAALVRTDSDGEAQAAVAALTVTLTEFAITPVDLAVPAEGAVVTVTNAGTQTHNLSVPQTGVRTRDLAPGQSDTIRIRPATGTVLDVICTIPGHEASGMRSRMHVGSAGPSDAQAGGQAGGAMGGPMGGSSPMTAEEMDRVMDAVAKKFPAKTAGHGGDPLAPTIASDGTKQFDLTAKIVDWEVEPGKFVKAWTYNGVVPGPEIRLEVGDKVAVTLHNELPESTALHFHGVRLPNEFDGVPPYTQAPIKPGESFTYAFTVTEPAVGMYHSHHDAQIQVPNGLAGAFLVGEMPLPDVLAERGITQVDQRVNMVLNDAGTIGLSLNGKSFPATEPYTMKVGETMLVNYFNEGLMSHPMHMHQPSGWIIAKDGIPLIDPIPGDTFSVAPGERYTVIYLAKDPGVWAWHCHILNHAEGPQGMFGMVTAVIVE